jgi:hypothetical protein
MARQDAVVAQAGALGGDDQAGGAERAGREDRHDDHVVAGAVAHVGRDDEHEAGLVWIGGLARSVGQPDLATAWVRHGSGGIVVPELASGGGAAHGIPGVAFGSVNAIWGLELRLQGAFEFVRPP